MTFKNSAALRAIAAELPADRILVETDAPYLAPGKYRGKRNEPAFVVETAKVLAETRGVSFDEIARQTTANFFRLFGKVPRPADADNYRRGQISRKAIVVHDAEIHHSRLRLFWRRTAAGFGLGRLRSEKSEKPPPAHLAPGRALRRGDGATRVLVDTPPDLREQMLDADVDWLDGVLYTHEHADHTHGIDDLRAFFLKQRRRIDVYLDEPTRPRCMSNSAIASNRRPAATIRRS